MSYEESGPAHRRPDYKPINIIFALTQARMALSDRRLELAREKFELVLEMDPENLEARDFMRKYSAGKKEKRPERDILRDCQKNAEGVCVYLDRSQRPLGAPGKTEAGKKKRAEQDFSIDEVFIITHDGLLVGHFTTGVQKIADADIMVGMLTALQMFMLEAFNDDELQIKTVQMNKFDVFFAQGSFVTICVVASGRKTYPVHGQVERFLRDLEHTFKDVFPSWGGNMGDLKAIKPMTLKLITGGYV